jgi:hypothetical protein
MADWVRFHRELTVPAKRGIPRAVRFIYMEISLEAKRKRGYVVLTPGLDDVAAVAECIGGDRREVAAAVKLLTAGSVPMWRFVTEEEERRLYVHEWRTWNPSDPTGSERQAKFRNGHRNGTHNGDSHDPDRNCSSGVTGPSARARANLLSSPSSSDLPLERESQRGSEPLEADGSRYVRLTDTLTDEFRATAEMERVQDIAGCWKKFRGHYADQWIHVAGKWQFWCVNEAKRERAERDRARTGKPGGAVDRDTVREAAEARDKRLAREREIEERARKALESEPTTEAP